MANGKTPARGGRGGDERLELLLLRTDRRRLFAINVLKIREIIDRPPLTRLPRSGSAVLGVARLRGESVPVIDLAAAIGQRPPAPEGHGGKVVVAAFNRTVQGFLVEAVERIVVADWSQMLPPPQGAAGGYVTGVIDIDGTLVQVLDVERILGETCPEPCADHEGPAPDPVISAAMRGRAVLVVDDSAIARTQTTRTLDQIEIPHLVARDGREALEIIEATAADHPRLREKLPLLLSDIEMPGLDGYALTRAVRDDPRCEGIHILLHTSLDGVVNADQARAAGADACLTKFVPELLASEVIAGLRRVLPED